MSAVTRYQSGREGKGSYARLSLFGRLSSSTDSNEARAFLEATLLQVDSCPRNTCSALILAAAMSSLVDPELSSSAATRKACSDDSSSLSESELAALVAAGRFDGSEVLVLARGDPV